MNHAGLIEISWTVHYPRTMRHQFSGWSAKALSALIDAGPGGLLVPDSHSHIHGGITALRSAGIDLASQREDDGSRFFLKAEALRVIRYETTGA
jgi:hypothetical protein